MSSDPTSQVGQPPQVARPITSTGTDVQERAASSESEAVEAHTVIHANQIWVDRLRLTSIYASFFMTVDGFLFQLASSRNDGSLSLMGKLTLSSLSGALVFHVATAAVAYMGSLVLVRHRLRVTRVAPGNPGSRATVIVADAGSADPCISEPTSLTSTQAPSALESGDVRFPENVQDNATSNAHPAPISATRIFTTTSTNVRPPPLSVITETPATPLYHPPRLSIDLQRMSLFNVHVVPGPCVGARVDDAEDEHDAGVAQQNAIALAILLNKCHDVCSCFALVGFVLGITGLVACVWELLEKSIAIFGSVCVAVCLILGFGALL